MKTLIIMRHAKTEEGKANQRDFDRELIYKGLKDAAAMGLWIRKKYNVVDEILCSAAKRTTHTATLVKEICGGELILNEALYHADANGLLSHIHEAKSSTNTLMVVGHNPAVSNLATYLSHKLIDLKPSDVAVFELSNNLWSEKLIVDSHKHHTEYHN